MNPINNPIAWSNIQMGPTTATSDAAFSYLTPDALMSYCQTRLQGIDTQVQAAFEQQQQANDDSTVLSNLSQNLALPSADVDLSCSGGIETAKQSADTMMKAANNLQDPTAKQALQSAAQKIYDRIDAVLGAVIKGDGGKWAKAVGNGLNPPSNEPHSAQLTDAQIENLMNNYHQNNPDASISTIDQADFKTLTASAVQNVQQDLNSNTQLSMINLQSLMSQRQEAIQVCTNLVQSLGDQANKVAENVGH